LNIRPKLYDTCSSKAIIKPGKDAIVSFILRFIDDVELRQAIEKQLNKGESANKFSKVITRHRRKKALERSGVFGKKLELKKCAAVQTKLNGRCVGWRP